MMTIKQYEEITDEVKNVLNNVLNELAISNSEDYILFLVNGEYDDIISRNKTLGLSPYTIDYKIDNYNDENRLVFLCDFLNKHYSFGTSAIIEYDFYRINTEMMIYSHIWESKPFLKNLYKLGSLLVGEEYKWKVEDSLFYVRSNFLKDHIIKPLSNINSPISELIQKGYNRVFRNSIAHSDYRIDSDGIIFVDYKGKTLEDKYLKMPIADWAIYFAYSFCLSYWFVKIKTERRKNIIKNFSQNKFRIKIPDTNGIVRKVVIEYDSERNDFYFASNAK